MAPPIVSDEQWREILAAALPCAPTATARAEIERALADYRGLVKDPRKLKAARARYRHMVKVGDEFLAALDARRRELPLPEHDPDQPLRDLQAVIPVVERAHRILVGLDMVVRARAKRQSPERYFLIGRLLDLWVDHFGGKLTVTDPTSRGPPAGRLVRFILAATKHELDPPISPHTIRDSVRREREGRLRVARWRKGVLKARK
jgi:hypothetical protein